jgi:hypothetical protein
LWANQHVASEKLIVPKAVLISARLSLAVAIVGSTLLRVQTYAEATVAETLSTQASSSTQTVSSNLVPPNNANSWTLPKECHPWAKFEAGSWREIEVTTETFDEHGKIFGRSVTIQKEVLKSVADESYAIEVQATVDVAGKKIAGPWNTRVLRLVTDRPGAVFTPRRQKEEFIPLNVGAVECEVFEVQYSEESRTLSDRIYFSREVFPHILMRYTSEHSDNALTQSAPEAITSVIARAVPFDLEGRVIECVTQQLVRHGEKGKSQTLSLLSPEIPGGEIRSHSTDFDTSGKRIRWSVQRLLAYGTTHTTTGQKAAIPSPSNANKR